MRASQSGLLAEAIYDAAVEPALWADVLHLFRREYTTGAEALYFLDYRGHSLQTVHVDGVGDGYVRSFRECFYTKDNPFTRAAPLHRPGAVRTDEQVMAFVRDPHALRRSRYYNDWMRPQDFGHTIGTTLLAEGARILNFSLLRTGRLGPFRQEEIATFRQLCGHLTRALRLAVRLETITLRRAISEEALDRLQHGVAFLTADGRVLYCNGVAEALLIESDGLALRNGRLMPKDRSAQAQLAAVLHELRQGPDAARRPPRTVVVPRQAAWPLILSATRVSSTRSGIARAQYGILLMIADPERRRAPDEPAMRAAYGLTPTEARLARVLVAGLSVRESAEAAGMTYETARWYLKILFQKTGTRRQADLVAKLLAVQSPLGPPRVLS